MQEAEAFYHECVLNLRKSSAALRSHMVSSQPVKANELAQFESAKADLIAINDYDKLNLREAMEIVGSTKKMSIPFTQAASPAERVQIVPNSNADIATVLSLALPVAQLPMNQVSPESCLIPFSCLSIFPKNLICPFTNCFVTLNFSLTVQPCLPIASSGPPSAGARANDPQVGDFTDLSFACNILKHLCPFICYPHSIHVAQCCFFSIRSRALRPRSKPVCRCQMRLSALLISRSFQTIYIVRTHSFDFARFQFLIVQCVDPFLI